MKVNVLDIGGPCEPGIYAMSRVEVSFDDQNSLIIDKLLVVQNKQGRLAVCIPCPREEDAYDDSPSYALSPTLAKCVARAVLDEYEVWSDRHRYPEPAGAPPSDVDSCITRD